MTGIPCPLQLLQGIVAAHLNRAFGCNGLLDIGVLDFPTRCPIQPRSPTGPHRSAAEGTGLELQGIAAFTRPFRFDADGDIRRVWIRFHVHFFP